MGLEGLVSFVTSVVMAMSPVLGFGGDWDLAYTAPASACRVASTELVNNGAPVFQCDGGNYSWADDEQSSVVATLASGSRTELKISYDTVTKDFRAEYTQSQSSDFREGGAGLVPVCIDAGGVIKRGASHYFDTHGTVSTVKLQWDACYQGQKAGIEFFTAVFDDPEGSSDPTIKFNGSPYRYFTTINEDGATSYGISWVDWIAEWTIEYDDLRTYTVSSAFRQNGLRHPDWPDWWKENILGKCVFGLTGGNPVNVSFGQGYLLAPLDRYMTAMTEHPCYRGNLDAFQQRYLNDWPITSYDGLPCFLATFDTGHGANWALRSAGLFGSSWDAPNSCGTTDGEAWFSDFGPKLDDGICVSESDNSGSDFIRSCSNSITLTNDLTDTMNRSSIFIQYKNFQNSPFAPWVAWCNDGNDPTYAPDRCQLGYAKLGVGGGASVPNALDIAVLVPTSNHEVGSGGPPLTGFDPDPTNPDPASQKYIYYDYSTGDTINTGICVHSSCVWNEWIYNAPVYYGPVYVGPQFECDDTIICLANWNAWWTSTMNYIDDLSDSWMDFLHAEAVWILGIVYPQNIDFDIFTMLLAIIENNAVKVALDNMVDGLLLAFKPYLGDLL